MYSQRSAVPRVSRRAFVGMLGLGALGVGTGLGAPRSAAAAQQTSAGVAAAGAAGPGGGRAPVPPFQAAAARALEGLLARLDASNGYRPHFTLDLTGEPARLVHDAYWDGVDLAGRSVDALIRLRRVLGGDAGAAEVGLRNYFLGRQGEQGLFYNDTEADGT